MIRLELKVGQQRFILSKPLNADEARARKRMWNKAFPGAQIIEHPYQADKPIAEVPQQ